MPWVFLKRIQIAMEHTYLVGKERVNEGDKQIAGNRKENDVRGAGFDYLFELKIKGSKKAAKAAKKKTSTNVSSHRCTPALIKWL